jgi:hypothetical protein
MFCFSVYVLKVNKIQQHHQLVNILFFKHISNNRNCRVSNINKHRPTIMYLSQFLITSAEMSIFIVFFFITNIKVGNKIHRFCLPMPFRFRKHKGHDLAYDVKIMTSQQRLSRIVTSTLFRYIYLLTPYAKLISKFAWAEQDLSTVSRSYHQILLTFKP